MLSQACVEKRKADAMQREAQQKQDMLNDSRATQHQNAGLLVTLRAIAHSCTNHG